MNEQTFLLCASITRLQDYYDGMDVGHSKKRILIKRIIDDLKTIVIL